MMVWGSAERGAGEQVRQEAGKKKQVVVGGCGALCGWLVLRQASQEEARRPRSTSSVTAATMTNTLLPP